MYRSYGKEKPAEFYNCSSALLSRPPGHTTHAASVVALDAATAGHHTILGLLYNVGHRSSYGAGDRTSSRHTLRRPPGVVSLLPCLPRLLLLLQIEMLHRLLLQLLGAEVGLGQRRDGHLRLHCTWDMVLLLLIRVHLLDDGRWRRQRRVLWGGRQWLVVGGGGLGWVPLWYVIVIVVIPAVGQNR